MVGGILFSAVIVACIFSVSSAFPAGQCGVNFAFANYYGNGMVLQRAPSAAVVWGYAFDVGDNVTVTMNVLGEDRIYETTSVNGTAGRAVWRVSLDPVEANVGGPYDITAASRDCVISIIDVLFGDVWLCSGQSNMAHEVAKLDNPEADIEDSVNYPNIRTLVSADVYADTPQEDAAVLRNWLVPNPDNIGDFSAVCWSFGTRLYDRLEIPIGLIESDWGGTRIEAWSSDEALAVCFPDGVPPYTGCCDGGAIRNAQNEPAALFNAMIHPFQQMPIYGALWYQGEENQSSYGTYACALREMVFDWRRSWFLKTGTTQLQFPFGVVQLAPNHPETTYNGFPNVRWAQTGDFGYMPNSLFERFFMAVAIDLADFDSPYGSAHPRYKRQIGERLVLGAMPVAYGLDLDTRFQGPLPTNFVRIDPTQMIITFDSGNTVLEERDTENTTAYQVCCSDDPNMFCGVDSVSWLHTPILNVSGADVLVSIPCSGQFITGVRYAWRESPCPLLEQCAVYSTDGSPIALPAPPFTYEGWIP